jgi:hypothetical protein
MVRNAVCCLVVSQAAIHRSMPAVCEHCPSWALSQLLDSSLCRAETKENMHMHRLSGRQVGGGTAAPRSPSRTSCVGIALSACVAGQRLEPDHAPSQRAPGSVD